MATLKDLLTWWFFPGRPPLELPLTETRRRLRQLREANATTAVEVEELERLLS